MEGTADFHHEITDTVFPQPDPVFCDAAALDAAVNMLDPQPTVVQGLGSGRYAVRSRHGQKGGRRCGGWYGDRGRWRLLQWADPGGGVGLRDTKPLRQSREGSGRGIAEGTQCRK